MNAEIAVIIGAGLAATSLALAGPAEAAGGHASPAHSAVGGERTPVIGPDAAFAFGPAPQLRLLVQTSINTSTLSADQVRSNASGVGFTAPTGVSSPMNHSTSRSLGDVGYWGL